MAAAVVDQLKVVRQAKVRLQAPSHLNFDEDSLEQLMFAIMDLGKDQ
jgi:hypothetical protein